MRVQTVLAESLFRRAAAYNIVVVAGFRRLWTARAACSGIIIMGQESVTKTFALRCQPSTPPPSTQPRQRSESMKTSGPGPAGVGPHADLSDNPCSFCYTEPCCPSSPLAGMAMKIELTDQQEQAVKQGRPVEIVDPASERTFVIIARELYDGVHPPSAASPAAPISPAAAASHGEVKPQRVPAERTAHSPRGGRRGQGVLQEVRLAAAGCGGGAETPVLLRRPVHLPPAHARGTCRHPDRGTVQGHTWSARPSC